MAELYLDWGGDLVLTQNGSVQMASGWDETRQFFVRTLLTNPASTAPNGFPLPADYIFDITYGVGLGQDVGRFLDQNDVLQKVTAAYNTTPNVNTFVPPSINLVQPVPHEFVLNVSLQLTDGTPGTIALSSS